jgi:hypothetical protein
MRSQATALFGHTGLRVRPFGSFEVTLDGVCQSVINPVLDVQKLLPRSVFADNFGNFDDQHEHSTA